VVVTTKTLDDTILASAKVIPFSWWLVNKVSGPFSLSSDRNDQKLRLYLGFYFFLLQVEPPDATTADLVQLLVAL
jgi:hypothetical protein